MKGLAFVLLGLLQAGQTARPTVLVKPSTGPVRNFEVLYYDEAFLFAARNYGRAGDVGGNTEPGLFVHSKEQSRWLRVDAISTAKGRFGKSLSDDPVVRKTLAASQVSWDFTAYAARPYIEQPLHTSGSVAFPEKIRYDADTSQYELRYFASWGVPAVETVLYINRADLVAAFARR